MIDDGIPPFALHRIIGIRLDHVAIGEGHERLDQGDAPYADGNDGRPHRALARSKQTHH